MTKRSRTLLQGACLLTLGLLLGGCASQENGGGAPPDTPSESAARPIPAAVQVMVDSGNLAFRGGDFESALSRFRDAVEGAPDHPVPLFGVYLASTALGDSALADSVATVLRDEAPWLLGMMGHPEGEAPADPHAGMVMMPPPDSQADTIG
ncbi:hypothetical protein ACGF5M_00465 [Gemmatimonadota bacterium]